MHPYSWLCIFIAALGMLVFFLLALGKCCLRFVVSEFWSHASSVLFYDVMLHGNVFLVGNDHPGLFVVIAFD